MGFISRAEQYRWLSREAHLKRVTSGDYIRIYELGLFCLLETEMPHYDKQTGKLLRDAKVYQLLYLDKETEEPVLAAPEVHQGTSQALVSFTSKEEITDRAWIGEYTVDKESLPNLLVTPYNEVIVDARYCHHLFLEIKRQLLSFEFPDRASDTVLDFASNGSPILFTLGDMLEYKKGCYKEAISIKPFISSPDIEDVDWVMIDWSGAGFIICEGEFASQRLFFGQSLKAIPPKEKTFYRGGFREKSFYQPARGAIYVIPDSCLAESGDRIYSKESFVYEVSLAIRHDARR